MITDVEEKDLAALAEMEKRCFTSFWNYEQFLYEYRENPFAHIKLLKEQDVLIGYMDYWITFECCQLNKIAIMETYRHQGHAKEMMEELIQSAEAANCETIMLEVRSSNIAAQQLYRKFGFIEMNIRKGYYTDNGEDAVIMAKGLGGNW